jgi:hypothetical protein
MDTTPQKQYGAEAKAIAELILKTLDKQQEYFKAAQNARTGIIAPGTRADYKKELLSESKVLEKQLRDKAKQILGQPVVIVKQNSIFGE